MEILKGKKGAVFGVANDKSIAWGIAQMLHKEGADLGLHLRGRNLGKTGAPSSRKCRIQNSSPL